MCGLIGIPPANGVIPQSPMHTKSLATLKHQVRQVKNVSYSLSNVNMCLTKKGPMVLLQLLRNRLVITARNSISKNASLGQLYGNMQEVYHQMQTPLIYQDPSARVSRS